VSAEPPQSSVGSPSPSAGRKWAQRLLFFVAGIAMTRVAAKLADRIPGPDGVVELLILGAVGMALLVLRMRRGEQWRWLSYAVGVVVVWGALLAFLFGGPAAAAWLNTSDFDAEEWRSAELGRSETRVWMVDDLLERPLVGMKVADVDALLGPDDSARGTGYGAGYWDGWDRVWWLGPERGFIRIDSEWLVLRVDDAGVVREAKLVRD
jgi:hypothetical protein